MAFDPNSIPKDLRPINIARTVAEDPRIATARNVPGWSHVNANGAANAPVRSASSQASDEGLDESVLGKKVKFLCSFGGKIMPRPNDGMLRYAGGETRIVSVRRDVSFLELVNKMISTYNQNVVIKYQLPDEDLDALVTVSCPDDLENMMDEYEKLVEKSSDGSAKLRVFLFPPSEVEKGRFGDSQDTNKRYVEALNGLRRIDSLTSAASTQNSDFSNTEAVDSSNNVLSPKANSVTTQDRSPRVMNVDSRFVGDTETSSAHLGVPVVPLAPQPVPAQQLVRNDIEMQIARNEDPMRIVDMETSSAHLGVPIVQSGPQAVSTHHPAPYYQTFVPAQHPMYTHQQFHDNGSGFVQPQQYMPPVHMTVPPPSHLSMRPNLVLPVMQPQHDQFGPRIIQLPNGQSYHAFPAHPSVIQSPQQQVMVGCDMCEKSLPHTHSDTVVQAQGQRASNTNPTIDTTSVYHSLHFNDKPRADLSGTTRIEHQYDNDRVNLQRAVNSDHSKAPFFQDVQMGFHQQQQQFQENTFQQLPLPTHHQYRQQIAMNPPVNNDIRLVHESPKKYSDILLATAPQEVAVDCYDNAREVERRMENLHIYPSESKPLVENAFVKPRTDFDTNYLHSNDMSKPPLLGTNHPGPDEGSYSNFPLPVVDPIQVAERVQPVDWSRDPLQLQSKLLPTNEGGVLASVSPVKKVADIQDSSNSLFSNQDPWNLQHVPPPLPNKIAPKKEGLGTRTPFDENQFCNIGELGKGNGEEARPALLLDQVDFGSGHTRTTQGSAEEQIKRDLQGVAEGVAASVLKSSILSDPDLTKLERKVNVSEAIRDKNVRNDIEMQKARNEEIKTKQEKANLGYPASDGLGRLQIIKNSDLEELRELGSGTFGTVYHGKWRGTDVAIKRINERCFAGKPSEIERMRDDFWNEAIKLADLHHPNVVAFYGVVLDGPGGSVATVTEYMVNGSLRTALQKNVRNLDKRKLLLIAMDVAFGMEYLHGKNIVHFDLKSDNLLVNLRDPHRPICKVGDLGLSKVKCQTLISGGVRGTLPWMAPELLNGSSSLVSEKVDVFSFGIVMWELLTGEEPYADLHYGTIIGGIVSNTLRPPVPESCDPEWRYLMERCWSAEPSERPNFTEIANELRVIATKVSSKAQNQQLSPSTQPQTKN